MEFVIWGFEIHDSVDGDSDRRESWEIRYFRAKQPWKARQGRSDQLSNEAMPCRMACLTSSATLHEILSNVVGLNKKHQSLREYLHYEYLGYIFHRDATIVQ